MFGKFFEDMQKKAAASIWNVPLSSPSLTADMRMMIEQVFIPAGIHPEKFLNNLVWLETQGRSTQGRGPSETAKDFARTMDRPKGFPVWYLAAFPDVASWVAYLMGEATLKHDKAAILLRDNLYARYQTIYPNSDMQGADGGNSASGS